MTTDESPPSRDPSIAAHSFKRSLAPGRWFRASLWALTLGAILAMTNLPGIGKSALRFTQGAGWTLQGVGVLCCVAAEVSRRRDRTRGREAERADANKPGKRAT